MHSRVQNEISTQALRLDSYFLIGGDRPVQKEYFENYGIFINREGEVIDQYLKQHPVPARNIRTQHYNRSREQSLSRCKKQM